MKATDAGDNGCVLCGAQVLGGADGVRCTECDGLIHGLCAAKHRKTCPALRRRNRASRVFATGLYLVVFGVVAWASPQRYPRYFRGPAWLTTALTVSVARWLLVLGIVLLSIGWWLGRRRAS